MAVVVAAGAPSPCDLPTSAAAAWRLACIAAKRARVYSWAWRCISARVIAGGRDGLTRIAHFLDGGAGAADEAGDTDKYRNEAQHKGDGH